VKPIINMGDLLAANPAVALLLILIAVAVIVGAIFILLVGLMTVGDTCGEIDRFIQDIDE
jgi:hypothetical protein